MEIKQLAVIGAGQMGAGIAQVAICAGIQTLLFDKDAARLKKAIFDIEKRLKSAVEKSSLSSERCRSALSALCSTDALPECGSVCLIIEAVVEDFSVKAALFAELDKQCQEHTIFASNTSSIPITKLAAETKRSDRCIGLHFMNPVPVMRLVEVIRGLQTSEQTYSSALDFVKKIEKTPVTARNDYPGFIVNRILVPMINEACFVLMEGTATVEEIDLAMTLGTNVPMGPLTLADFVGLDTCLAICRIFHAELGEDKYRPCPLLVKYVESGWLGRKSGRGFYRYN